MYFIDWLNEIKLLLFAALIVFAFSFYVSKHYRAKWFEHENFPIYTGLKYLFLAYVGSASIWNIILPLICDVLNKLWGTAIVQTPSDLVSFLLFLIFNIAVCTILFFFYSYRFKIFIRDVGAHGQMNDRIKRTPPPEIPMKHPIFQKRIRYLFELKHKKLKLEYDTKLKILFGSYRDGLREFLLILYCHDTKSKVNVSENAVSQKHLELELEFQNRFSNTKGKIVEYYYLLENGKVAKSDHLEIHAFTESDFLESVIDFDLYLEKIIEIHNSSPLPFSSSDSDLTLADTYIASTYNSGKHNRQCPNLS